MDKINITINGKKVSANPGQTILEAAKENGIAIPTLCHDERLKPFGSCLLCRVEVEGARGNMLACGTEVSEGMVIRTETDEVADSRRVCLELLLSQHYGDCKAPCSLACPAGIDVQGYIAHIANGEYTEAIKLIKERNPLPLVCGRVCTRPCEDECRRNLVDERVGIDYLKRFVADYDLKSEKPYIPQVKEKTGKKAAVIGAGPAGLSCAYYLSIEGHDVTIFERWPKGGGMLRYGIPEYRLPKDVLDAEIDIIKSLGVNIEYNKTFGVDITYDSLKKDGYNAIFLGVGSQVGQPMGCDGESCTRGVFSGVDFLGRVGLGDNIDLSGKSVIVVGGGNTAIDAARTSLRLGADSVKIAYRRTKAEMPAHEMEIEEALYEGAQLIELIAPTKLYQSDDSNISIEFVKMKLGDIDASGRRRPEPISGSEYVENVHLVIAAIGQTQDLTFINDAFKLAVDRNRIKIDEKLMTTNIEGVFAGGDTVTGPNTAISAIAAGRRGAYSMDKYMKNVEITPLPEYYNHTKGKLNEIDKEEFIEYEKIQKEKMPMLDKKDRDKSFKEVELGFSEEQAKKEAKRCLSCGCKDVNECKLREYATLYGAKQDKFAGTITKHPIDESHPFIIRDQNKCIMCGRCVRICLELQGAGALGFISRGYNTIVSPSFGLSFGEESRCESCGQCISTCPVGALTEKVKLQKPGPFLEDKYNTICNHCGTGCSIELNMVGQKYIRTTSKVGVGVNNGNLCEKGKFKNDFIDSDNRIKSPFIRKDGILVETSWEEAIEVIGSNLNEIKSKADDISVFVSEKLTNEEIYLTQKLAREGLNTRKISSLLRSKAAFGLMDTLGKKMCSAKYEDIEKSDLIVLFGFDIKESNPVAALMVKDAVLNGAKLIIVYDKETKLDRFASKLIRIGNEDMSSVLGEIKNQIADSKNPMIITGGEITRQEAAEIAKMDAKILLMHKNCNTQGSIDMGAAYCLMPGYIETGYIHNEDDYSSALLIFGEDPLSEDDSTHKEIFEKSKFKVVCDMTITETAKVADVVLPLSSFAQSSGTYTNSEGRVQKLHRASLPICQYENYEVIMRIAKALGLTLDYSCIEEVTTEVKSIYNIK